MVATHGLTIGDVKGDTDWSALEEDLLAECRQGRFAVLAGKDDCPADTQDRDRRVRPALIRYLLEGGCPDGVRPHPKGVKLRGGWIDGALDLQDCRTELDLSLHHCLFRQRPSFRDAEFGGLYLTGSRAENGLDLQRLRTETNVHLRNGFHATGPVDLGGSRIGGKLSCSGSRFDGAGERALDAKSAIVGASVFLRKVHAVGEVNFRLAKIGGQLSCTGGRFEGKGSVALNLNAVIVRMSVLASRRVSRVRKCQFQARPDRGELGDQSGLARPRYQPQNRADHRSAFLA